MKTTKTQAKAQYDDFFGVLRCLNGGTSEENRRNSAHCLKRLEEEAAKASELAANAGKLVRNDPFLWEALTVTIPARLASFKERYPEAAGGVVIDFPAQP